jgi:lipopolysaccharide transport system ATP-binding protein
MQSIIQAKNIGKRYSIKHARGGYVALRDVIMNVLKSPFRFLKEKAKSVASKGTTEEFWALKNVSFDIMPGEIIGIIGSNGAGKSTLLKILSGITPPTTGEIIMRGRAASLLEVGTGFHPELTGRENIFLNGAILGMTKAEIARKFDEIVEFAGIEKFIDTPVKYYSSGMYVRLAFSVAAHMEPDILVVDEVLAVGDTEFQKKCLGKMEEVTRKQGRTILFVSHNLEAVERLCTKTMLLKKGEVVKFGETSEVINYYINVDRTFNSVIEYPPKPQLDGQITRVRILDQSGKPASQIPVGETFSIEVDLDIRTRIEKKLLFLYFSYQGELLLWSTEGDRSGEYRNYEPGKYTTRIEVPAQLFQIGLLSLNIGLKHLSDGRHSVDTVFDIGIEIINDKNPREKIFGEGYWGKVSSILEYSTRKH